LAQVKDLGAPLITNFEPEQYKANSQNWVAVQDRRGVLYFGNTTGILEFDGQRWQLIPTPGNAPTRALACGPDGTIYYGSINDIGYLATSATGKVTTVSLREAIPTVDRSFNDVWQVESCADGIYFLTQNRIFRLKEGKVTALDGKWGTSSCVVNGTLFYTDKEKGLCLLRGNQVVPIPQLAKVPNGKRLSLAAFGPSEMLVGRLSGDFLRIDLAPLWDEASQTFDVTRPVAKEGLIHPFPTELDHLVTQENAFMYKLLPLGGETFAVCTVKAGILLFDRAGKLLRVLNKASGLLDNSINGLLVDRSQDFWVASDLGISQIALSLPQSVFGTRNGIEGLPISAHTYRDRMYVGTTQNLFVQAPFRYSMKEDQPKFVRVKNGPSEIWQFQVVEGDLMAASGLGLFQIQGEAAFKVSPGPALSSLCLGISRRWPSHLFVGGSGGIHVFKRTSGTWTAVGKVDGVTENIVQIAEDPEGDLWLSTDVKGLLRAHFTGEAPTQMGIHRFGPEQGLPGPEGLRTVFQGEARYILSPEGLFSATVQPWNPEGPDRTRFAPDPGLGKLLSDPPVVLNDAVPDGRNGYIFITSLGAIWARAQTGGSFQKTRRPFEGIVPQGAYAHPDGSVWLLGKAAYRVDPWAPKDYDQPFEVLIRKVVSKARRSVFEGTHGQENMTLQRQCTIFQQAQPPKEAPELPYRENALTFEFAATFYEHPGALQFQYLLEGFDANWSEWDTDSSKEYTNIPEGQYSFRVKARNAYGVEGREAVYAFRINPPWYRAIWALLLWILGGAAALAGIIHLYTLRLRRQKAHLEQLVVKRTQQLRDASLTDPLTGLRNRRFITEILQADVLAFLNYKTHLLETGNNRAGGREGEVFGLFLMDIDHFKQVNDAYGHDAGDLVLKQFAEILKASVRQDDVVIRLGGEEFLVVLKKSLPEYLDTFAAKLLEKVATTPFDLGGGTLLHKTCSIGYTSFPLYQGDPTLMSFEQCITAADHGMYYAKHHGRNRAVSLVEGPNLPTAKSALQKVMTSLEFALEEGHLKIGRDGSSE
jgi:diguanylate cyclase (GGDEF)-like protein